MSVNVTNQSKDQEELASDFAERLNSDGVAAVISQLPKGESLEFCEECGVDIPEKRRLAIKGVKYCIDCQTIFEKKNKHRGRGAAPFVEYED